VDDVRDRATLTLAIVLGLLVVVTTAAEAQDGPAALSDMSDGVAGAVQQGTRALADRADEAAAAISKPLDDAWSATITREPRLTAPPRPARAPKPQQATRPAIWPDETRKPRSASSGRTHALSGIASYYWQGTQTASGEPFDKRAMTAAHPSLPFGTKVRVFCKSTGRQVVVRINDRGPFKPGRVIDLSEGAAEVIGMRGRGLTTVQLEVMRH
jgi:rare lipoprotein A